MTGNPTWNLREHDGRLEWWHDCAHGRVLALLPISTDWWVVEQANPLSVTPSILCYECRTHGYIRNGEWESA